MKSCLRGRRTGQTRGQRGWEAGGLRSREGSPQSQYRGEDASGLSGSGGRRGLQGEVRGDEEGKEERRANPRRGRRLYAGQRGSAVSKRF